MFVCHWLCQCEEPVNQQRPENTGRASGTRFVADQRLPKIRNTLMELAVYRLFVATACGRPMPRGTGPAGAV